MKFLLFTIAITSLYGVAFGQPSEADRRAAVAARGPATRVAAPEIREQFLAIERIARLPHDEQVNHLPRLYEAEFNGQISGMIMVEGILSRMPPAKLLVPDRTPGVRDDLTLSWGAELEEAAKTMSPEQVADAINTANGITILRVATRRRGLYVMIKNRPELIEIINQDLAKEAKQATHRAYGAISEFQLSEFFDRAMKTYLEGGPLAGEAQRVVEVSRKNPEVIKILLQEVEREPATLMRHARMLELALAGKPAEPLLVKLLESPSPDVRAAATLALQQTDCSAFMDSIPKLMSDPDQRVRLGGVRIAFRLPEGVFGVVRWSLVPALSSRVLEERVLAATGFAGKMDPIAAPVLLALIKDVNVPQQPRGSIDLAVRRLMARPQTRLVLSDWGPQNPQNAQVIADLERWIAQNPAPAK